MRTLTVAVVTGFTLLALAVVYEGSRGTDTYSDAEAIATAYLWRLRPNRPQHAVQR